MTNAQAADRTSQMPLRLMPAAVIVALQWFLRFVLPAIVPFSAVLFGGLFAGLLGGVAVLMWWAFFSRAPRLDRWGGASLLILLPVLISPLLHESIATAMAGLMFPFYVTPVLSLAFVAWAALSRRLQDVPRRATMVATILLVCVGWTLLRTEGMTGAVQHVFAWRWSETPEERILALGEEELVASSSGRVPSDTDPIWPGFRGPGRDGIVRGTRIGTDWAASRPTELWRRPIGPGWSSFAVSGDRLYTQEQRGDEEVVACYSVSTGEPVWWHRDRARFWEAHAGAGPRGTPTLSGSHVYTFGASGILNALDARDGSVLWSRDTAPDTEALIPYWGRASSPLVVDDLVIVAVSGALAAYDKATGEPRWVGPDGGAGYSSPHLLTIAGVDQVLLLSAAGVTSVAPIGGAPLWEHAWPSDDGSRVVQPALAGNGDVLVGTGNGTGIRRLGISRGPGGWIVEERWTSTGLKPEFNDFVVHKGHAYGFDGRVLACIDLADGARSWKGGRYGSGQLVLLADQDLLLVVSEKGGLALVQAAPDRFTELARISAIEGKTWNHPVLVGDVLLIRNGQEMAAFRLSLAGA